MHHPPRTKTNGWAEGRGGKVVQQMADNKNATGAGSKSLTPVAMAAGSKGKGRRKFSGCVTDQSADTVCGGLVVLYTLSFSLHHTTLCLSSTFCNCYTLSLLSLSSATIREGSRQAQLVKLSKVYQIETTKSRFKSEKMCEWEEQMRLKEAEYERMKREIAERDRMITEQARMIAEQARMIEERDGWIRTATGQPELDHMEDEDEEEEQNENVDEAGANEAGYVASRYEPFGAGWARGFSNDVKN
uniref:No apical meristem-associated C-terminal domain-containing protein n=1 Tax=Globodera rostochiensis TaxID=31243 RepID=A0A914I990_GLORO